MEITAASKQSRINRLYQISILFGICVIVVQIRFAFTASLLCTAGTLLFGFALVVQTISNLIYGFIRCRRETSLWFLPCLLAFGFLLSYPLATRIGTIWADWSFKWHLSEYRSIVEEAKNVALPA